VDFENSGWGDRADALADIVEHVQSRNTPDDAWTEFAAGFDLSAGERARFEATRRMMNMLWVFKRWQRYIDTPGEETYAAFAAQIERAEYVCECSML
jgi:hypothetical protein